MPITLLDSFQSTGTSASPTVTSTSGNFQFQVAFVIINDILTITPPSGWTNLTTFSGGSGANKIAGVLSYNAATTIPAGGTLTWSLGSTSANYAITLARFLDLSAFVAGNGLYASSSTTLLTPSITSGDGKGLLIMGIGQKSPSTCTFSNPLIKNTTSGTTLYTPTLITSSQIGSTQGTQLYNLMYYQLVDMVSQPITGQVTSSDSQQGSYFLAAFNYKASISKVASIF
ncbi:MAG: hypothetical protein ACKOD2_16655 [Ilumatobacteraceae bacterium]